MHYWYLQLLIETEIRVIVLPFDFLERQCRGKGRYQPVGV